MVTSNVWLNCYSDDSSYGQTRIAVAVIPFAAALGIDIWSIVDAVRIAKIKNMYEQDLKKLYSMSFNLYPSINYIHTANGLQPTAGFTFALNF